jgi:hypothetical protein
MVRSAQPGTFTQVTPGRGAELVCALVQAKLMPDVPPPMRVARGCGRDICCGSASRSCVEECKAGAPERSAKESAAPSGATIRPARPSLDTAR